MNDNRPGCLGGLLRLAVLKWLFGFLQDRFGYGKEDKSCSSIGCGTLLLILFILMVCYVLFNTDWTHFAPLFF